MGMTILVTGANGFVGKNLVRHLAQNPEITVVATDIHPQHVRLAGDTGGSITYVSGDLSDKKLNAQLRDEFRFDCIIHLAAILSQAEDMETYFSVLDSNTYTTFLLLETARSHNARFIFPSTALVYGNKKAPFTEDMFPDPEVFYALSKHMSEELIRFYERKYNLISAIFRIGILYGTGQTGNQFIPSMIAMLDAGDTFDMTGGEQVRDFVHIDDFIHAVQNTLVRKSACGIFNIGTGKAPTMREVALKIRQLMNVPSGAINIGSLPYRKNEVWEYRLDNTKARQELGWNPSIELEDGLQSTIDYYRHYLGMAAQGNK